MIICHPTGTSKITLKKVQCDWTVFPVYAPNSILLPNATCNPSKSVFPSKDYDGNLEL